MESGGVITEIAHAAFAKEGHQSSIEWYPWVRAMKMAKLGEADVLMDAYYSKERADKYRYSNPVFDVDIGLIAHKNLNIKEYTNLESLKPYNIGVMLGWVYPTEFDNAEFLKKHVIVNQNAAARMLLAHRVDMVAASTRVFKHEINLLKKGGSVKAQGNNTVVLKPLLGSKKLYLLFNRVNDNSEKLLADFNRGLAKIRGDGTFDKILAKHGF